MAKKWELSDAAIKRIEKRCMEAWKAGETDTAAVKFVHRMMAPEDFGSNRRALRELVKYWIRESGSSAFRTLAAQVFESQWFDLEGMREGSRDLQAALVKLGVIDDEG